MNLLEHEPLPLLKNRPLFVFVQKSLALALLLFLLLVAASCATSQSVSEPGPDSAAVTAPAPVAEPAAGPAAEPVLELSPMVAPSKNEEAARAYNLGTEMLHAERYAEAEESLLRALELDPEFVDAMDHLGLVYRRLGRYAEAEAIYKKSIEVNSTNPVPYVNLATTYTYQGKNEEAFQVYLALMAMDPSNPEAYYGIGRLFYLYNSYEEALSHARQAADLYLEQGSSYIYDAINLIGYCLKELGDYQGALEHFQIITTFYPDYNGVSEVIQELNALLAEQ